MNGSVAQLVRAVISKTTGCGFESHLNRQTKDKFYIKIEDSWVHRTPLKVSINPILRLLQWFTDKPYVIASKTSWKDGKPHYTGYTFTKVKFNRRKS